MYHFNGHFLLCFLFANDITCCLFSILDYRNDVRQKANSSNFLKFMFKMGHKAAETTRNVSNTFVPGTAIEQTVQWWFKKFCKGDQRLEDEEHSGWPSEVDNDQLSAIINADPLYNYKRSCQRTQKSDILWSFSILSKSERWKSSISGYLVIWPPIKKNRCFEVSSSLVLHKNNEPFLNWIVTCDEKWILYDNWLSGWTEKFQSTYQSQTCTSQTHYNFLNPGETITSEKYAQQVDYYYYYFFEAGIGQQKGPNYPPQQFLTTHRTISASKVEQTGLRSFASSVIFTWSLANWLPLPQASWQLFAGKMLPQSARGRKCFLIVCWILKHGFLHYRNKQTYFLLARMYWL